MTKIKKISTILLTVLAMAVSMTMQVTAADSIGFSVKPRLPENQHGDAGYFNLMVQPGMKQDLIVTVINKSDQDIVVSVEAITASTNRNGIINYTAPGPTDETLKHSFADMATIPQPKVTIPAQSEQDVTVSITVPDEPFDGILLGSIQVLKELTEEELNSEQAIVNQYSYVTAVRLQENEAGVATDFVLGSVTSELVNYRAAIVANIRNPQPKLVKDVSVTTQIYPQGSDTPIFERTMEKVEFAPNSVFPCTLSDDAGYGIQAGNYVAKIRLLSEGREWSFDHEFEVKSEQAANLNKDALNQTQQRQTAAGTPLGGLPLWAIIAIMAGIMIVAAVVIYTVVQRKQYNKFMEEMNSRYNKS